MKNQKHKIILVADSHIADKNDAVEFFSMLENISKLNGDYSVVFLGDIFELWIALPEYENEIHHKFIAWATNESKSRTVAFIEGNHEFFPAKTRKKAFSVSSDKAITLDSCRFVHGDLINKDDWKYFILRYFIRNMFIRTLLRITGAWIGPKLAEKVRTGLKNKNLKHKKNIPEKRINEFCIEQSKTGCKRAFAGHFHQQKLFQFNDFKLNIIPDAGQKIVCAVYDPQLDTIETAPWRELSPFKIERK